MDLSPANPVPTSYWNGIRKLFLVWAVIILAGFTFTYFAQTLSPTNINLSWAVLACIGLVYSKKQMPFSDRALRNIFFAWLGIIILGIAVSQAAFFWSPLFLVASYLGAFWLLLMAFGHAVTGIIDRKKVYIFTVAGQLAAAVFIYIFANSMPSLYTLQYLVAGVVGSASMLLLLL